MRWIWIACLVPAGVLLAEFADTLPPSTEHPEIHYSRPSNDLVAKLDAKLRAGSAKLAWQSRGGYLKAVLDALDVPVESQVFVQSKTSLQSPLISPENPRSVFFNDSVAVAWMNGGFIEIAAQDPVQGVIFYLMDQDPQQSPRLRRNDSCLSCHRNDATFGTPGVFARSTVIGPGGEPLLIYGSDFVDHRTPLEKRWGGWYVTGSPTGVTHMGNAVLKDRDNPPAPNPPVLATLTGRFPVEKYLSPHSDAAALLVFDHQMYMMSLLTRLGWDTRAGTDVSEGVRAVVDYMLFLNEAKLTKPMGGGSVFAAKFEARGPKDSKGRSLRTLNLKTRLLEYPCSYMIYSEVFDALPGPARAAIYRRMWEVLRASSKEEHRAVVEILRETKAEVREYFR